MPAHGPQIVPPVATPQPTETEELQAQERKLAKGPEVREVSSVPDSHPEASSTPGTKPAAAPKPATPASTPKPAAPAKPAAAPKPAAGASSDSQDAVREMLKRMWPTWELR